MRVYGSNGRHGDAYSGQFVFPDRDAADGALRRRAAEYLRNKQARASARLRKSQAASKKAQS